MSAYTHKMLPLPPEYDTAATEKKWQKHWLENKTFAWDANVPREDSYVIDTPPPTVSGHLHMGHVFSYTQADFVARYQRMIGKNVFYPMGFDDNGLPTERLVEKSKKIRAADVGREKFIELCNEVAEEARRDFRALFQSIALSVDWSQEYSTISDRVRKLSQLSFLDLVKKEQVYRKLQPMLWDPVDQTAIAQAEVVDKELPSHFTDIAFTCAHTKEELVIGTTRPELLAACVALFFHPEDERYKKHKGHEAIVPLFGFKVPILTDDSVEMEKGTGLMMCCTFGDEEDIKKWQKYNLKTHVVLNKFGKLEFGWRFRLGNTTSVVLGKQKILPDSEILGFAFSPAQLGQVEFITSNDVADFKKACDILLSIEGKKTSNPDKNNPGAREIILEELKTASLIRKQETITHAVKCAERSGAVLELIPTFQWFVKVLDKKEALKKKAAESVWHPEWMKVRMDQWIDGLNWDWCISRQRYFGVPFPVWYVKKWQIDLDADAVATVHMHPLRAVLANADMLPLNPLSTKIPPGFKELSAKEGMVSQGITKGEKGSVELSIGLPGTPCEALQDIYSYDGKELWFTKGEKVVVNPDPDVMDTWATSSISPQLSAHGISADSAEDKNRFAKLYPADLRPQAHEIIRTWAFYTLVKSFLHSTSIPWKNLMISGWCLAEDKTKMSKSKGNVVTPVALIEEKGTDAVRYWAGTSRLGQDTAFSPDLLKIGKKLVGKLWNATQFAAIHLSKLSDAPTTPATDKTITETLDRWILSRLGETVAAATSAFNEYEYAEALDKTNAFFWADFCDNYLELIKKRVYNEDGSASGAAQQSAIRTLYYVLDGILKLYAPFVPHVTEELYAHIFAAEYAKTKSLHARNQWPNAKNYPHDEKAIISGKAATHWLEQVRKKKSDNNKSIKYPVKLLRINLPPLFTSGTDTYEMKSMLNDLKGAGNISQIDWKHPQDNAVLLDSTTNFEIEFAESADAA